MLFKDHFQQQLNNKIKECDSCPLKANPGPVLGYGSLNADTMFISDAPKDEEIRTGIPFTGTSKERMVKAIDNLGFNKGEYYFTYLIKHQLTDGQKPEIMYHKPCLKILLEEIELINPRIICSMGFYVTNFLMNEYLMEEAKTPMKDLHGNGYIIPALIKRKKTIRPKRYLIPTWSPAVDNILMNKDFETDVMTIKTVRQLGILLYD